MKGLLLSTALLVLLVPCQADAFIFTDLVAQAQRVSMIAQAAEHLRQIQTYREEFERYKLLFDRYFASFRRVYRRIGSLDWGNPATWGRLQDHLITIWKTFDEQAWQTQVLALRVSPLYTSSPEYREYADKLVSLSEEQAVQLKREEAHLIELQAQDAAHHEALDRFRSHNAALIQGEDTEGNEVAISQQIALTNAILIELASIQAETKIVEQRLLTQQKEARNLIMRMKQLEIEAQRGDVRNLDLLLDLTRNN
jgi:hypothetical protein